MEADYTDRFLRTTRGVATEDQNDPRTVLHAAFTAIIEGDFNAFGDSVTDDVELSISGMGTLDGVWRGRDEVIAAAQSNFDKLRDQKPEIERMIFQDDCVAVLLRETGAVKSSGRPYEVRGVQWFTFSNGKIKRIEEIISGFAA